jgi:uncharacterized surface anchored protein
MGETNPLATNLTNMTGGVNFYHLDSGNYDLTAILDDYMIKSTTIYLSEGVDKQITLRLDPVILLYSLTGVVYDNQTYLPLLGAKLSLTYHDGEILFAQEITDQDGEFLWENLPNGNYTVSIEKEGYYDNSININISGPEFTFNTDFWLDPIPLPPPTTGDIIGIVKDADTSGIITDANVTLVSLSQLKQSDSLGNYEFSNISEGNYTVNVSHPDYISQEKNITVIAGKLVYLNFTLSKKEETLPPPPPPPPPPEKAVITDNVTDEEGNPVKAALIKDSTNNTLAVTDQQGYFQITDLEPGTYVFRAEARDFVGKNTDAIVLMEGDVVDIVVTLEKEVEPKDEGQDEGISGSILFILIVLVLIVLIIIILIKKGKKKQREPPLEDELHTEQGVPEEDNNKSTHNNHDRPD